MQSIFTISCSFISYHSVMYRKDKLNMTQFSGMKEFSAHAVMSW